MTKTNWIEKNISDIAEITSSKRIYLSEYVPSGIPFFRGKEIIEKYNGNDVSTELFIKEEKYNEIKNKFGVPSVGDILLTSVGTIGIPYFVEDNEKFYFKDGNLTWFRKFNKDICSKFLYYWIVSPEGNGKIKNRSIGSSQSALTIVSIKGMKILLPPLSIQQKIASILSAYDDLIENNNKRIKILEEIMKSFYKNQFIENKQEEWEKTSLDNCCKKIGSGSTPSRKKQEYWNNADIKWFKTKELSDGFLLDSEEKISNLGFENSSTKLFPKNTVLMAIYAAPTLGRLGILTSDSTFNQAACGLLADETKLSTTFLFLKLLEMRGYFNMMAMGSAQQNISVEKVRTTEIVLPPLDLIKKFDLVAKPIFDSILNLTRKKEVLLNLKNLLLPKLISGELDVEGLDIKIRPEIL